MVSDYAGSGGSECSHALGRQVGGLSVWWGFKQGSQNHRFQCAQVLAIRCGLASICGTRLLGFLKALLGSCATMCLHTESRTNLHSYILDLISFSSSPFCHRPPRKQPRLPLWLTLYSLLPRRTSVSVVTSDPRAEIYPVSSDGLDTFVSSVRRKSFFSA